MEKSPTPPGLPASPTPIFPNSSEEAFKPLLNYTSPKVNQTSKVSSPIQTPTLCNMSARGKTFAEPGDAADATLESDIEATSQVNQAADNPEDVPSLVIPHLADSCGGRARILGEDGTVRSDDEEKTVTLANHAPPLVFMPNGDGGGTHQDAAPHSPHEVIGSASGTNGKSCGLLGISSVSCVVKAEIFLILGGVANVGQELPGASSPNHAELAASKHIKEAKEADKKETTSIMEVVEQTPVKGEREQKVFEADDHQPSQDAVEPDTAVQQARSSDLDEQQQVTKASGSAVERTVVSSTSSTDVENRNPSGPRSNYTDGDGDCSKYLPAHLRPNLQGCPRASYAQISGVRTPLKYS